MNILIMYIILLITTILDGILNNIIVVNPILYSNNSIPKAFANVLISFLLKNFDNRRNTTPSPTLPITVR